MRTKRSGTKKKSGRRPPERAARAHNAARSRSGAAKPLEKVAPWRDWTPVALRASIGTGAYPVQFTVSGLAPEQNARYSELITSAAHKHFKIEQPPREGEGPAAYLVGVSLRVVYDTLVVQFEPGVPPARCSAILDEAGFREVERSRLVKNKWIVRHARPGVAGESLLAAADTFKRFEEVRFAWPNSVAEYRRASGTAPNARRWWLDKIGVNFSTGKRRLLKGESSVVIAVLDDGVDIDHPNLASRVAADPGRDFAVAVNQPGHNNPRPKVQVAAGPESDYHGTLCAGLICSDGKKKKFLGVAPGCTLVAVRVIDGPELISESWLADAISYATGVADVISCSWIGPEHVDVVAALDDTTQGRGGKGTAVFCAAGNNGTVVAFPARHVRAIAVGACDSEDGTTDYSNFGDDLSVVAPSSNGIMVYSTDVSQQGWGYNTGQPGDAAGLFYKEFGQTSAATAIAAGVGALCFSVNPSLTADELRNVLQNTAVQIGAPGIFYNAQPGHSQEFGYGCINAVAAVAKALPIAMAQAKKKKKKKKRKRQRKRQRRRRRRRHAGERRAGSPAHDLEAPWASRVNQWEKQVALYDRPWWGKNHTLWGGETFKSTATRPNLGIVSGDRFRVEKGSNNKKTLIPHPGNRGTWKDSHSKSNPIQLTTVSGTPNERAYSMMVKITATSAPRQVFLIERANGTIAVTQDAGDPGANGGTASLER